MSLHPDTTELEPALALLEARFAQTLVALPGGAQVAVRATAASQGDAPVIVLLHGIGSGAGSWLFVATALGAQARVLAWDAPGYGASMPLPMAAPTAADYAQRLQELLAALRIERCVLVGHSLGALMACAFAADRGRHVVSRLVLVSPARGYGGADSTEARRQVLATRLGKLRDMGIEGMAAEAPARMLSAEAGPSARAWVRRNAALLNPAGYAQAVQMLCGGDLMAHAAMDMPVLVACGDADQITPPETCRQVAAHFGAPFETIARAGHASPVEQSASVARLVAGAANLFLNEETT
jgi:pimeloyl-ACP methyl ester carboxylesterase